MLSKKINTGILLSVLSLLVIACGGESEKQQVDSTAADTASTSQTITQAAPEAKLNINTATEESFLTIPGVGDKMAYEFEEYRPYVSIRQFRQEMGKYVDEETVAAYEQYIFVPIDANESDAATLLQIPGLDETEADALISGRPYDSMDAFANALSEYISEEEMETAKGYMKS